MTPVPVAAIRRYVGCFTVELDPVEFRSTYPEVIDAIRGFTTAAPGEAAHALEPAVGADVEREAAATRPVAFGRRWVGGRRKSFV